MPDGDADISVIWRLVVEHGENRERIDSSASGTDTPVEVRTCHPPCRSDLSDLLSGRDTVTFAHIDDGQVGQQGK